MKARPNLFENPTHGGIKILKEIEEIHEAEIEEAKKLAARNLPIEYALVGIVYQDQYLYIVRDAVVFSGDGEYSNQIKKGMFIRIIEPILKGMSGVIVLPVYQEHILLFRQFRHATRTWHIEILRGFAINTCSGEENARKALYEEIGGIASRLVSLGQLHPNTGMTSEIDELFFAEVESYADAEIGEAITDILPTPRHHAALCVVIHEKQTSGDLRGSISTQLF
jgi:ADP-ribose pyrophosphatase